MSPKSPSVPDAATQQQGPLVLGGCAYVEEGWGGGEKPREGPAKQEPIQLIVHFNFVGCLSLTALEFFGQEFL